MRVTVDRDLCEANAVCAGLVPEIFDVDDEDVLHIAAGDVPPELADGARRAAESCPKTALRIEE
jgi:ferredoxin